MTTAANWVSGSAAVVDPEFTVVAGGLGALLHVKFPDRAAVYTTLGAAVGVAQPVRSSIVTEGGPINAVARKLSGATFFLQKFSTAEVPGDVLLAPKHIGDIATIRMDGSSEYFMARHAYLASTPHLSLSPRVSRIGAGFDSGLINMKVSGKGTLAVTTYGGLLRLVLGPGEVYHVHAKYVPSSHTHPQSTERENERERERTRENERERQPKGGPTHARGVRAQPRPRSAPG